MKLTPPASLYKSLYVPVLGWSVSVSRDPDSPCRGLGTSRGRCQERIVRVVVFGWDFEFRGRGKSYRKLVGFDLSLDWILDEFDSSFNELAAASLRFHLNHSVCDNEARRPLYEDLIARLSEPAPEVCDTDEKRTAWRAHIDEKRALESGLRKPTPPEIRAIFDDFNERHAAYLERIRQARHDFVDIIPGLWS